jgi:hypothetical protein
MRRAAVAASGRWAPARAPAHAQLLRWPRLSLARLRGSRQRPLPLPVRRSQPRPAPAVDLCAASEAAKGFASSVARMASRQAPRSSPFANGSCHISSVSVGRDHADVATRDGTLQERCERSRRSPVGYPKGWVCGAGSPARTRGPWPLRTARERPPAPGRRPPTHSSPRRPRWPRGSRPDVPTRRSRGRRPPRGSPPRAPRARSRPSVARRGRPPRQRPRPTPRRVSHPARPLPRAPRRATAAASRRPMPEGPWAMPGASSCCASTPDLPASLSLQAAESTSLPGTLASLYARCPA